MLVTRVRTVSLARLDLSAASSAARQAFQAVVVYLVRISNCF